MSSTTETNKFLEKLHKREMCLFVDPMDCIKQGKKKNQKIPLSTDWAPGDADGTKTCCEEVPQGTCGDGKKGDTWRKEYCWSLGRDWKGGTITKDGLDCCKPMDTDLTCKKWDWTKCWTVVGDRGQYTKELAKIPDPRHGYPYRDENPLLFCDNENDDKNCKGGSLFPSGDCGSDSAPSDPSDPAEKCSSENVCKNLTAAEKAACRQWDQDWLIQRKNLLERVRNADDIGKCCKEYNGESTDGDLDLVCKGNLYVGDIASSPDLDKEEVLWGNIKYFVSKDGPGYAEYNCGDGDFAPEKNTSCICRNCSAGSAFYDKNKNDLDFKVEQDVSAVGCEIQRDCEERTCYYNDGEGNFSKAKWNDMCTNGGGIETEGCLCESGSPQVEEKPAGGETDAAVIKWRESIKANKSSCKFYKDGEEGCEPVFCMELKDKSGGPGCKAEGAANQNDAIPDILDSMGYGQECKQQADSLATSFAASTSASCPFGSVGAQVSATAMDNSMSQSGCGVLAAQLTNVSNVQRAETCSETNVSNAQEMNISGKATIKIETIALKPVELDFYNKQLNNLSKTQQLYNSFALNPNIGDRQYKIITNGQKILDEQYKAIYALMERDVNIIDSNIEANAQVTVKNIVQNTTNIAANMASEFEAKTASKAEADMSMKLGVNALSPNAKQLIAQNIRNENLQTVNVLSNIISNTKFSGNASSNVTLSVPGNINIKGTTITATTNLDIMNKIINDAAVSLGQSISSKVINDVTNSLETSNESAGLEDLVQALGDANANAIKANKTDFAFSPMMLLYLIGGIVLLALIGFAFKSMTSSGNNQTSNSWF
jgi:hypothetical protein